MEQIENLTPEQVNNLAKNENLIEVFSILYNLVSQWNRPFISRYHMELSNPDVEAILLEGLTKAYATYDEKRGDFRPYSTRVIQNLFRDEYRKKNSKKEQKLHSISFNEELGNTEVSSDNTFDPNLGFGEKFSSVLHLLSKKERTILEKISLGYKPRQIAEELGISRKSVYNAICRFKEKSKLLI